MKGGNRKVLSTPSVASLLVPPVAGGQWSTEYRVQITDERLQITDSRRKGGLSPWDRGEYHAVGRGWISLGGRGGNYSFHVFAYLIHPLRRFAPRPPVSGGQSAGAVKL